ncbi:MAG: bifunctional pyr operon transcriptional regulator/uracil phosphoribosyltransferase PyrR [Lautropia sp.]|nr:bifunctional pyr operon transcriptional regulator/uracil phosphoribosyltransferase PyrR [Lautropia sp.]
MTTPLPADAETLFARLRDSLKTALAAEAAAGAETPAFIGIHTGGAWLAARLHHELGLDSPLGFLSSAFYRDDVQARGLSARMQPTRIDFEVAGRSIVLVDDILHTGRTIRAALNEIFDYGRPARVRLAVLIDRLERELPVQPDHVGAQIPLKAGERLVLSQQTSGLFDLRIEEK